jgi:two-component system cell cycle sensor histidine kinase/response regulator CckA
MSHTSPRETAKTILVVDDAEPIRKMVCAMLMQSGYCCLEAADGVEAVSILNENATVHLVLTDVVMPNLGGTELAQYVARSFPELPVIFMSGYSDDQVVATLARPAWFIPKPFTASVLIDKVKEAFERP